MRRVLVVLALAPAPALPVTAAAHHGWSEYDSGRPLKLAPPSRMERRSLEKGILKPGATVTVEGYPNRDKPEEMRAERIIVNGKTAELR